MILKRRLIPWLMMKDCACFRAPTLFLSEGACIKLRDNGALLILQYLSGNFAPILVIENVIYGFLPDTPMLIEYRFFCGRSQEWKPPRQVMDPRGLWAPCRPLAHAFGKSCCAHLLNNMDRISTSETLFILLGTNTQTKSISHQRRKHQFLTTEDIQSLPRLWWKIHEFMICIFCNFPWKRDNETSKTQKASLKWQLHSKLELHWFQLRGSQDAITKKTIPSPRRPVILSFDFMTRRHLIRTVE